MAQRAAKAEQGRPANGFNEREPLEALLDSQHLMDERQRERQSGVVLSRKSSFISRLDRIFWDSAESISHLPDECAREWRSMDGLPRPASSPWRFRLT